MVLGAHRHGRDPDGDGAHCLASCQDAGLHLSGHPAPSLDHLPDGCLACQFRAEHQARLADDRPHSRGPADRTAGALPRPLTRFGSIRRLSCRAPPLA